MNLFVTVGAQMPFDRLIAAIDRWAASQPGHQIVAQVHEQSTFRPRHIEAHRFFAPPDFEAACAEADVIIGHAGIGTLFAALQLGKTIIVMPRDPGLRETRNDHQAATARRFERFDGVMVAWDEAELLTKLSALTAGRREEGVLNREANGPLIDRLKAFIDAPL